VVNNTNAMHQFDVMEDDVTSSPLLSSTSGA